MHVFPREPFFKHVTQWVIWCFGFIQLAKGTIAGTHRRNDKQGEGWWRASNLNWGWFFAAWIVLNCLHYHFTPSNSPHLALLVRLNGTGIALVECDFSFWERCISSHFNELQVTLQCDHLAQTVSLCQNCDKPTCSVPLWPYHGKSAQQTSKEKERYSTWTYNFYQMFIIFRSAYSSVRAWLPHLNEDEGSSLREAFQEFSAIHIC